MFTNCLTPWAYLNAVGGSILTVAAWRLGVSLWPAVVALPLWQLLEVSLYYPWSDPGIPISMFLNPILGMVIVPLVLASDVSPRKSAADIPT
ncbi:hypothetical protein GOEFS_094_00190 [Gordonia effusa NBRC 100432]|uniref:Uncharacterized protein n=2 Tax=Gordonia effusa TaxID=263908 RepID=H0R3R9_9ACTN|nr:hypothetical protein GOEFS_094_00190 [Gordonia effusa NBRC 100432]